MAVLLLNVNGAPHRLIDERQALGLLLRGKAVLAQAGEQPLRSAGGAHPRPSVLYLTVYAPVRPVAWSRREVLARDGYRCAYCGRPGHTVDHVLPRHLCRTQSRPANTWENTVAACLDCQRRKGGQTLAQAGMKFRPRFRPAAPRQLRPSWLRAARQHPGWEAFL